MRKKEMGMSAPKGSGYAGKDSMRAKAKSAMGASMGMTKKCAKYAEGGSVKSKHKKMDVDSALRVDVIPMRNDAPKRSVPKHMLEAFGQKKTGISEKVKDFMMPKVDRHAADRMKQKLENDVRSGKIRPEHLMENLKEVGKYAAGGAAKSKNDMMDSFQKETENAIRNGRFPAKDPKASKGAPAHMLDAFSKEVERPLRGKVGMKEAMSEKKRIGAYAAGGAAKVRKGVATAKGMPIKQPTIKKGK